ncbi:hypothetical protein FDECE_14265 [Fusarium decemcellulare]|nr:hypothetical protein FDECE_14265 [Fusarium decemcellulare]
MPPDAPTGAIQPSRSCDRCFSLKTQCDLAEVCGRCRRLGLECTNLRPVRPKGRPRKPDRPSEVPESPDPCLSPLADLIKGCLDQASTRRLGPALAEALIEHITSTSHGHGFYATLLRIDPLESSVRVSNNQSSGIVAGPEMSLTPTLVSSLLSVALDLLQQSPVLPDQQSTTLNQDLLLASSLARIPQVSSRHEPSVPDALSLLFFSYTWCFTCQHLDMSRRWATLARVIITDAIRHPVLGCHAFQGLSQRTFVGIALQERILGLLHYNNSDPSPYEQGTVSSGMRLGKVQNVLVVRASRYPGRLRFVIELMVFRVADFVLQEPQSGSCAWRDAYDALEEFYIFFPPGLLKYDDVEFLYQAESMIWMHGLYIILYVGRDLLSILMDPDALSGETLRHALGHSLLLGEILPTVDRLGGEFEFISPALLLFVLVSSAIQIAVLGRYLFDLGNIDTTTNTDLDVALGSPTFSVPAKLVESSWRHLQIVSAIRSRCGRYDSPLVTEIQRLLASCHSCVALGCQQSQAIPATTLMLYRWKGRGTGINPLEKSVAISEWSFSSPPEVDIHESLAGHITSRSATLDREHLISSIIMPPNIAVIHNLPAIEPQIYDGPGTYSDLAGTESGENPLVTGVWDILDFDEPTPSAIATTDEAKLTDNYAGEAVIKNEWTGEIHELKPGSMLWIPAGANLSIVSSRGCRTVYFEARQMVLPGQEENSEAAIQVLQTKLDEAVAGFIGQNPSSQKAIARASEGLPGGTTRAVLDSEPFPLVVSSGKGSTLTTVDGKTYVDFVSDFTAGLFGHSNPDIQEAICQAVSNGVSLGAVTELEARLSESIKARFPSIDLVRFCNSGTEANMYALATALAYTGRKKVLVFDRAYHGGTLSFGDGPNDLNVPYDYVVGTYGDIEKTRSVLSFDIAAIIVEPMQSAGGMRPAGKEFLSFLRNAATTIGAVLIFDEVVTSRLAFEGMQGVHGIKPDMTTLGKYLGGGLPFGAFGGRRDIMAQFDPKSGSDKKLSHSGTFNNNILTMSAAVAASRIVTRDAIDRINAMGDRCRKGISTIVEEADKVGAVVPLGVGSCIGIYFTGDHGDLMPELLFFHLLSRGLWIGRRGFLALNFAHEDPDIDQFLEVFKEFLSLHQ